MVSQYKVPFGRSKGIEYLNLTTEDTPGFRIADYFQQTRDFIEHVREQRGKILVHCVAGLNRSVTVIMAWMVCRTGLTLEQAVDRVSSRRPSSMILSNLSFLGQLVDLTGMC